MTNIVARNAQRGLPGCIGSIDCTRWKWTSCPKALHGEYQAYKKTRSIVIEAVCDEDLRTYHWFVGAPGNLNDSNVWHESPLKDAILEGKRPPANRRFSVYGRERSMLYYLADGIYPSDPFLVSPFSNPNSKKQKTFNRRQGAVRKDVERLFAVVIARFHVALHPGRYRSAVTLTTTSQAVAILHNIVVEQRRGGLTGRLRMASTDALRMLGDAPCAGRADSAAADEKGDGGAVSNSQRRPVRGRNQGAAAGAEDTLQAVSSKERLACRAEVTHRAECARLRIGLAEHVWSDCGEFLAPYVE